MIRMAVFLGNAGKEYEKTRHNAGFMLCSFLYPDAVFSVKFHSAWTKEGSLVIIKPLTLMNRSGTAVSEAASFYKLKAEEILVVHDDLELELGKAVLQRSIKERLGSDSFFRLRIGIGRPVHGDSARYVLSPFAKDEIIKLEQLFSLIASSPFLTAYELQLSV